MNIDSKKILGLEINAPAEIENITERIRNTVKTFKKRGAVIGISGGIDSSVVLSLCVRALGADNIIAVTMPEKESDPDSTLLAENLAEQFRVKYIREDITGVLEGFGCYKRRDEAIKNIFPEYDTSYKSKIYIHNNSYKSNHLNFFKIIIESPQGEKKTARIPVKEYLQIVAASNLKQRSRMSILYFHAELNNYAVIGTANKNEHMQGFFVKYGDGGADIKPIAHLLKTQVYLIAEQLNIPSPIMRRIPTTDTYSSDQSQEEFFFGISFEILDAVWSGWEKGIPAESISEYLDLPVVEIKNIISDIERKISSTEYLRTHII